LSYSHYFRNCFKLVYRKNVVMVTLTTGIMLLLFTCLHFCVWGILRKSACVPTAYEVVRGCWKFEKHCVKLWENMQFWNYSYEQYVNVGGGGE
jgi:hypothetical protein